MSDLEAGEHRDTERTADRRKDRSRSRDRRRRSRSRDRSRRSRSRDRRRSRSKSRDRRRSRSRSKSPSGYDPDRKRRRPTWFDIQPVGGVAPPISSLPGAVQVTMDAPASGRTANYDQTASTQQATRHARRIYVGGLPPSAGEQTIANFFSNALAAVGGTTAGPGNCVVNVYINAEKKFAFVEMRTVEEASNAMALDGIMLEGVTVRIRRPADYKPAEAAALGPAAPNPNLNLAAIGLDRMREQAAAAAAAAAAPQGQTQQAPSMQEHNPNRLFVGGLPYYLDEAGCRELLSSFGAIKTFDLIKDRERGTSKGYGFCLYEDPSVTEIAIAGLNGMQMGDRSLTVKRAESGARNTMPMVAASMNPNGAVQPAMFTAAAPRVVKLTEAITPEELADDEEYKDILEDMQEEFARFGQVNQVLIPRPPKDPSLPSPPGVGKVLVEFVEPSAAQAARNAMHGRKFGGRVVVATLVTEEDFKEGRYD